MSTDKFDIEAARDLANLDPEDTQQMLLAACEEIERKDQMLKTEEHMYALAHERYTRQLDEFVDSNAKLFQRVKELEEEKQKEYYLTGLDTRLREVLDKQESERWSYNTLITRLRELTK